MVEVIDNNPNDWKEFCEATGKKYEERMELLALYQFKMNILKKGWV